MQNKSTYLSEIPTDQKSLSERIERNKNMIGKAINHGSVAVTYSDLRARAYDNLLIIGELQAENQALLAKNGELAKQIDEEKLRTFVHQADSNCAKNDRQSDRVFYQKCLKNVKFERDCLKTKVKELEGKVEEARKLIWHEDYADLSPNDMILQLNEALTKISGGTPKPPTKTKEIDAE